MCGYVCIGMCVCVEVPVMCVSIASMCMGMCVGLCVGTNNICVLCVCLGEVCRGRFSV